MDVVVTDAEGERMLTLISLFEDYGLRGLKLNDYCLYDYCTLDYKDRKQGGIPFESTHPQHQTHTQFVRRISAAIPTLLGNLLFLKRNSENASDRENFYCILVSLFFPWSSLNLPNPLDLSWEAIFNSTKDKLSSRLQRHIANLDLLHRTNEEIKIDRLQRQAQFDGDDSASDVSDQNIDGHDMLTDQMGDVNEWDIQFHVNDLQGVVEMCNEIGSDLYVREAIDASTMNKYFEPNESGSSMQIDTPELLYSSISLSELKNSFKSLEVHVKTLVANDSQQIPLLFDRSPSVHPDVYLTNSLEIDAAINLITAQFTLNAEQERAFKIIALHSLGYSKVG
jgi:hypothetical protein